MNIHPASFGRNLGLALLPRYRPHCHDRSRPLPPQPSAGGPIPRPKCSRLPLRQFLSPLLQQSLQTPPDTFLFPPDCGVLHVAAAVIATLDANPHSPSLETISTAIPGSRSATSCQKICRQDKPRPRLRCGSKLRPLYRGPRPSQGNSRIIRHRGPAVPAPLCRARCRQRPRSLVHGLGPESVHASLSSIIAPQASTRAATLTPHGLVHHCSPACVHSASSGAWGSSPASVHVVSSTAVTPLASRGLG